jgi:hypothetical protein
MKAPRLRTMYMPDADCWDWANGYDWEPLPEPLHGVSLAPVSQVGRQDEQTRHTNTERQRNTQ